MNLIAKYVTPAGEYSIDEDLNIYKGKNRDFSYTAQTVQDAVRYVEETINKEMMSIRDGLRAQIDMLSIQLDKLEINPLASDYRVKL